MLLESYMQALLKLIHDGKITVDQIKSQEYREEVQQRLTTQQTYNVQQQLTNVLSREEKVNLLSKILFDD